MFDQRLKWLGYVGKENITFSMCESTLWKITEINYTISIFEVIFFT